MTGLFNNNFELISISQKDKMKSMFEVITTSLGLALTILLVSLVSLYVVILVFEPIVILIIMIINKFKKKANGNKTKEGSN